MSDENMGKDLLDEKEKMEHEEKKEEVEEQEKIDIMDDDEEYDVQFNDSSANSDLSRQEMKKKLIKFMVICVGVVVVLGIILGIASLFSKNSYTYEDVEDVMKEAAKSYFSDHPKKLPKGSQTVAITAGTLINNEYMDSFDEYLGEDAKCSGKVSVKKIEGKHVYTPYLNCGSAYKTTELYKELEKKVVTEGSGLYAVNDNYIFRGEKVKNYVKLGKNKWRVVKINSNNEIMLVLNPSDKVASLWDDRYNVNTDSNAGVNDYRASRLRESLKKVYSTKDEYDKILSVNDKAKLTTFDVCVGKRNPGSASKDNSSECSDILGNEKIAALTVSDYIYASLDLNCVNDTSLACQNYNYLNNGQEWLTATAVSSNTTEIFFVNGNGEVEVVDASSYSNIRPVVMLNDRAMIKGGKGTLTNPYIIK